MRDQAREPDMIDLVWYLRVSRPIRSEGCSTRSRKLRTAIAQKRMIRLAAIRWFAPAGQGRDETLCRRSECRNRYTFSDSASHRVLGHIEQRCGPLVFARVYGKLDRKVQSLATGGRGGIATVNRWADLRVNLEWRDRVGPLADTNARRNECQSTGSVLAVSK
jgi:hypothetical protein